MKLVLCILVACVITVILTVALGLNGLPAFFTGVTVGFISQIIAAVWEGSC